MAYSATPAGFPSLIAQGIGGKDKIYKYRTTDAAATVRVSGYITNGTELGMKVGDTVMNVETDNAVPGLNHVMTVASVSSTFPGAVDLNDGVSTGANTD